MTASSFLVHNLSTKEELLRASKDEGFLNFFKLSQSRDAMIGDSSHVRGQSALGPLNQFNKMDINTRHQMPLMLLLLHITYYHSL